MASLALTAALVLPFAPHTVTDLEAWQDSWTARAVDTLTVTLMDERRDWHDRHAWFFHPEPQTVTAPRIRAVSHPPSAGVEQWRELVAYFWPAEHVDRMLRIMDCESGGDPNIPNGQGSGALGLFQIMPFWQRVWPGDYTDPWTNVAVAYQIWLQQGYGAWVCKG